MTKNEKNIKAVILAGEIEKYSPEYFQLTGSIGGKKSAEKRKLLTPEERSRRALKAWETRRKKV